MKSNGPPPYLIILSVIGMLSLFMFGIYLIVTSNEEWRNSPKETWVVPQNSFELNGKKCSEYYIYYGINKPKWVDRAQVVGRFVKCENDNAPSVLETPYKGGWQ